MLSASSRTVQTREMVLGISEEQSIQSKEQGQTNRESKNQELETRRQRDKEN
jgi:hypothetical protein